MSNFSFLNNTNEFRLFANACIEAEKVYETSPAMSAIGARKALELAVKWVYSADTDVRMPYKDNLNTLVNEPTFRQVLDEDTWKKLDFVIKLGNVAVHTSRDISRPKAMLSLKSLFEFVDWISYCYGSVYEERSFNEELIPKKEMAIDKDKIKSAESLIEQKDSEIESLRAIIAGMSEKYTDSKDEHKDKRSFGHAFSTSEADVRKQYIDVDLALMGWTLGDDVRTEVKLITGEKADYVLYGKNGKPLAVIESKKSALNQNVGQTQAKMYADALERQYGVRPMMFLTNGFDVTFWDDTISPPRRVGSIFSKDDLTKLMQRKSSIKDLYDIVIDENITNRAYQIEAIRAVCENIVKGHRRSLLVMATGTGKTRTAVSLVDVLSKGGYVKNILFLADRLSLVSQAKQAFDLHLKALSTCNLVENKDDKNARVVISTYQTMMNAIDNTYTDDGVRLFSPAHFDLIIVDEAHRSIFNKYKAIFEYFDAIMVGLTATPREAVDRNTYSFFEVEEGVPTFAYGYNDAVERDKVLVPYVALEVKSKFIEEGIVYADLSDEEKEKYEDEFSDGEGIPDIIPPEHINEFIFNKDTIDTVIQNLMEYGIKVGSGDMIGKSIIFAQNINHARFIQERFDKLYPEYKGNVAKVIVSEDPRAQSIIYEFKVPNKFPYVAISVDMLDTGLDVPEIVNLVMFKRIKSKIKFWQMLGRGTRLCKDLELVDSIDGKYIDKRRFFVFDYLKNFEYFSMNVNADDMKQTVSITELIFQKRIDIIKKLQDKKFVNDDYLQGYRDELIKTTVEQIEALNTDKFNVRLVLKHVEKYNKISRFDKLIEEDVHHLKDEIAKLVSSKSGDDAAKRFDNLIYQLINEHLDNGSCGTNTRNRVQVIAMELQYLKSIIEVSNNMELIKQIQNDEYWENVSVSELEDIRLRLRNLVDFIIVEPKKIKIIDIDDEFKDPKFRAPVTPYDNFQDYKLKVNRYIEENPGNLAIHKLRNNLPLTETDYKNLEYILTKELGTKEDYKNEFKDTPFGLMVRSITKLDRQAANEVFAKFIIDESLNQDQIVFVNKIIDYVICNGYIEDNTILTRAPFDRPGRIDMLFDNSKAIKLATLINSIRENAINIHAQ